MFIEEKNDSNSMDNKCIPMNFNKTNKKNLLRRWNKWNCMHEKKAVSRDELRCDQVGMRMK